MTGFEESVIRDELDYKPGIAIGSFKPVKHVYLDKDQLYNIIEFIEFNFIDSIRNDTDIDNIDYIISMMSALQKFRLAYASIKLEEESQESSQEEIK